MKLECKKIMIIFGTRPEATKLAPVIQELRRFPEWFETRIVVTGQHREQLRQVLSHFQIQPDIDLALMKENQSLAYLTSEAIVKLDKVIAEERPHFILVHGDTQTALSGAMAAFFHKIPVGHIEAGLRSHHKYSPWPEEINRKVVDVVSDLLFAPTVDSKANLMKEGYPEAQIYVTGQTAVDAARLTRKPNYRFEEYRLNTLVEQRGRIITVTAHRKENYGSPMAGMFRAIRRIAEGNPHVSILYPVHLSPVVRETASQILSGHERIHLLPPLSYPDMINLIAHSYLILSDSGGLQEEAPVFRRPLVLMRDTTERPEGIKANTVCLTGTDEARIHAITSKLLNDKQEYEAMTQGENPFGDGAASQRIVQILAHYFDFVPKLPTEFQGQQSNFSKKLL